MPKSTQHLADDGSIGGKKVSTPRTRRDAPYTNGNRGNSHNSSKKKKKSKTKY